ncbi:hypothetical protein EXIGLDRAFT_846589, partial [Exidia glandulosa HHB12029]
MYCNASHQKAHWKAHKYFCVPPQQMGLHIHLDGGSEVFTPTFVPKVTSPSLGTLNRPALAKILECDPEDLNVMEAPVCSVLPTSASRIALVFDRRLSTPYSSTDDSDISVLARAKQLYGGTLGSARVLVFYLQDRDFTIEPDYKAAVAAAKAWVAVGLPASGKDVDIVRNLYESASSVKVPETDLATPDPQFFQCLVLPALGDKPFISRLPLWLHQSDEYEGAPQFHTFPKLKYLGD